MGPLEIFLHADRAIEGVIAGIPDDRSAGVTVCSPSAVCAAVCEQDRRRVLR